MIYTSNYDSPIGNILLASRDAKLIGLWIEGQTPYLEKLKDKIQPNDKEEILVKTKQWLSRYFNGEKPKIENLDLAPIGSEFATKVWKLLKEIPYGEVTTYGAIAKKMAKIRKKEKMSAQAVGGAVGHNPISIIIPCHRVIGSDGSLTGYGGGIDIKIKLLKLEKVNIRNLKE